MKPVSLIISCEHAVNYIPPENLHLFAHHQYLLNDYEAYDLGARAISEHLSHVFNAPCIFGQVSKLLVDLCRSANKYRCLSDFTHNLTKAEKQQLIDLYYIPTRQQLTNLIEEQINAGKQVLHLSIHTFPEIKNIKKRDTAIGLMYAPIRHAEQEVARIWRGILSQQTPAYLARINYPHCDKNHDFANQMRKIYLENEYLGLELQVNQALLEDHDSFSQLIEHLTLSLKELLQLLFV